jgi:serine/threonine protein kinase
MSHNRYIRVRGRVFLVRGRRKLGPHEYLILKTLGHGGRQRYLAFDPSAGPGGDLRQIIVLNRRETLSQRIAILQRLSQGNPNLPTILVYDPGRSETSIVTTWVWGEDLDKYLKAARKGCVSLPSPTETCKLLRGLAHGLYHLYKGHGIIHGDIKPANLILAPDPNRLVMVDFGSAWTVEKTVRRLEGDGVSEAYAAPEQLMHRPAVDFRSDQF